MTKSNFKKSVMTSF